MGSYRSNFLVLTGTCGYILAGNRLDLCGLRNCSVFMASFRPGNKFSYSVGSARDEAAFLLGSDSLHSWTTL